MSMRFNPLSGKFDIVEPMKIGGSVNDGTSGSVLFIDSNGKLSQNNSSFFWDDTNHRLGIGINAPDRTLTISDGTVKIGFEVENHAVNTGSYGFSLEPTGTNPRMFSISNPGVNRQAMMFCHTNGAYTTFGISSSSDSGSTWSPRFIITGSGNVAIGKATPSYQLDITKNIGIVNTTNTSKYGIIYKGGARFIHNFNYGDNGTVVTNGYNLFIGRNAGNFTMGSTATSIYQSSYNVCVGEESGYYLTTGNYNLFIGRRAGYKNTSGYHNVYMGANAGYENGSGYYNVFLGVNAGRYNTTGSSGIFIGKSSGYSNTTGSSNFFIGMGAGYKCTTGSRNIAMGKYSLYSITTGNDNTAIGYQSGRYISDGITANETASYSTFIGRDTKALADGDTNETVIGYGAIGAGSNTVTLGNSSVVLTILRGTVNMAGLPTSSTGLNTGDVYIDVDTLKIVT